MPVGPCLLPQELLERGVCEEVERVRLSERYQAMKVHRAAPGRGTELHGPPPEPQHMVHAMSGGKWGQWVPPGVREGLTEELAGQPTPDIHEAARWRRTRSLF